MRTGRTKGQIISRAKEIIKKQGVLETELDLLWKELQALKDPMFSGWSKHKWQSYLAERI